MTPLSEKELVLYPASYNKKGLLGDFEVMVLTEEGLQSLSGRTGPYTSVREYFEGAGKSLLQKDPEYVLAALRPGVTESGEMSGSSGKQMLLYHVSREDAEALEELEAKLEPIDTITIL